MKSNRIAFIFARGGSKGVPGKNLKSLGGKPLIAHAIASGLAADSVDRVVVSTDSEDIAAAARDYGAEVPFIRPEELARDETPEWLAWRHAIETMRTMEGPDCPAHFISLPATSPFRAPEDIDQCVHLLEQGDCDMVITVTEAARNPWFNMVTRKPDGEVQLVMNADGSISRRQDAPEVFDITTVAYAARPGYILEASRLFDGRVKAAEVPAERALDIDTPLDFEIAKFLYSRNIAGSNA